MPQMPCNRKSEEQGHPDQFNVGSKKIAYAFYGREFLDNTQTNGKFKQSLIIMFDKKLSAVAGWLSCINIFSSSLSFRQCFSVCLLTCNWPMVGESVLHPVLCTENFPKDNFISWCCSEIAGFFQSVSRWKKTSFRYPWHSLVIF